jgi:hypothetical protein
VLLIELFTVHLWIPVNPCGSWVLLIATKSTTSAEFVVLLPSFRFVCGCVLLPAHAEV